MFGLPRAPDLAGAVLDGRYQLLALIGDGAFGCVYRGRDLRLARTVAVKVIKPWWADDPEWVRSFDQEAQLLARVSDPGIVQIFDIGQAEEGLYYVAEFVDGESLASRLRRGPLPVMQACDIARQLARALGHAHAQRVVHRDVKPANVLISKGGRVKVGDFGVARLAEGTADGTGTIVGTPRYMAPEQARGLPATAASDVYSVGAVLYEMLAGAPPFTGASAVELAMAHTYDVPPPLPEEVPDEVAEVVERALAKEPAERFESAGAMADALAHADVGSRELAGVGTTARRTSPPRVQPNPKHAAAAPKVEPTRPAPRFTPRRNVNPAARRRSAAVLGGALALLAAMIVAAMVLAPATQVRLPDLRGLTRSAIAAMARHLHLRPSFTSRYDNHTAGRAIAQSPGPGSSVSTGSRVRIVLSGGPPPVKVPALAGLSAGDARAILGSLGLNATATAVPAPGVQPGLVTGQSPIAGRYLRARGSVALSVSETPIWRPLTSFTGERSVPFRIRAKQWRVVYRMSYVGTCTFIFICDGPSARVLQLSTRATVASFDLNDGDDQQRVIHAGPGLYQLKVAPGSDTARWSVAVQDYY